LLAANRIGCAGKDPKKKSGQTKSYNNDSNVSQNGAPLICETTTSSGFYDHITLPWIDTNEIRCKRVRKVTPPYPLPSRLSLLFQGKS
jgi:hypothetical protein